MVRDLHAQSLREKWNERYSKNSKVFLNDKDRLREQKITDIPILFGVDGSIICIPRREEPSNVAIVGSKGKGKCCWEETDVFTKKGIKKIKDVEIGDEVISLNKTHQTEYKKIIEKEKVISKNNLKIITESGEEIICSKEHKFLVRDNNLKIYKKEAKDINLKYDFLIKISSISKNKILPVKIKKIEKVEKELVMYHLEVKDNHNFMLDNTIMSCNSLLLHRLVDEIFWLWNEMVFIMNDIQEECFSWNHPQKNALWINQLKTINESPLALPMVYVHPHTNSLNLDHSKLKEEINFIETTIPFSEVISHSKVYLKLGDSIRYITGIREELLNCEIPQDIIDLIETKYPGKQNKQMRDKILISFDNIFDEEILNISQKNFPSKISTTPGVIGNPFIILARLGLIPCLETSDMSVKRYAPQVFAHHLNSIFQSKFRGGLLEGQTTYILFDEMTHVCSDEDKNSAYDSLCKIAARGRKLLTGIIYATQNYSRIPRKIKNNTNYVLAFNHTSEEEVKKIAKDYDLGKLNWKEIIHLESFEVVAITNEFFTCYKDGKIWTTKGPLKGTLIPPLSNHQKPQ